MPVSKEVQMAVDEIHRERDALRAAAKANELQASQISDLKIQIQALKPGTELSAEDKQALLDAVNGAGETSDALATAVPANVATAPADPAYVEPTPPPNDPLAPRPDPIAGTGLAGTVPLMPNMAFDPAGGVNHGPGDAGQPNQAPTIETAGGFIVAGGGNTARAPGSRPDSPSSSVVVPADPDAKAPASTADEAKSGLGDSSQNALIGNDLQPVADGPGIAKATDDDKAKERAAAAQQQAAGSGQAPASPAS